MISRPDAAEYASFYADYVSRVPEGDVCEILEAQLREYKEVFTRVSEELAAKPRSENEWTLKQVLGHLAEAERIFGYRALRISRGDQTPLAGFDQDDYMREANYNQRTVPDLLAEFEHLRRANICLFRSLDEAASRRIGTASDAAVSVRALVFITSGHAGRHLQLVQERYEL